MMLRRELSDNNESPILYTWCYDSYDCYRYFANDKWTGLFIVPVRHLWLKPMKAIVLKEVRYRISFCLDDGKGYDLVDESNIIKAKKIAEWYYKEWLKVKNNKVRGVSGVKL